MKDYEKEIRAILDKGRSKHKIKIFLLVIIVILTLGALIWYSFPATTFTETGLPLNIQWSITYSQGYAEGSIATTTGTSITVYLFRFGGAYTWESTQTVITVNETSYCNPNPLNGVITAGGTTNIKFSCN